MMVVLVLVLVVVVAEHDRLRFVHANMKRKVSEIAITEVRAAAQVSWWLK